MSPSRDEATGAAPGPDPDELARELRAFPAALRDLLTAELAAGNAVIEVGHTHPAPPAGAYLKLGRKVTSRPRASGNGLDFYDRNGSLHSGEFTDAARFYFIIEPPNPPPSEPDMDAIRRAADPGSDPLMQLAERRAGTGAAWASGAGAATDIETQTGRQHELYFRDRRAPHLVQFALERELRVLFAAELTDGALRFRARAEVIGAHYDVELRFLQALPGDNCYQLVADVSWADHAPAHHDYFRRTSASWLEFWTREFTPAAPPPPGTGSPDRYRQLAAAALDAEAHLDSVPAIHTEIITRLKSGGRYATAHKEGGSNLFWRGDCFVCSDYGEDPATITYENEARFLEALRHFCHHDTTRHAGREPPPELDTWKLILRFMIAP